MPYDRMCRSICLQWASKRLTRFGQLQDALMVVYLSNLTRTQISIADAWLFFHSEGVTRFEEKISGLFGLAPEM